SVRPMRTHARGFWGAAAAAVVLLPLMTGCGNDDDGDDGGAGADEGGGTLTIYSGREEDLIGPLFEDFSEETGIEVEVRYGDSADLALLIDEEGDNSPAAAFISQSPGAVGLPAAAGRHAEADASLVAP